MMDAKQTDTNSTTELARERTREAADRTLMAWIRTSLSLIGFGFTANKVLGVLEAGKPASPLHSTLVFALSFIALGAFGLLGAIIPRHTQRGESKQAIEKNDDQSLKCKRGKVGWKRDI